MKKIIKALRHPLYYLGLLFPSLQSFRSAYQKEYGLDSSSEITLMKEIKRNIPKDKNCIIVCPPKKWVIKLRSANYKHFFVYDFNQKHLEEISDKNIGKKILSQVEDIPFFDYGVYFNILNSMEEKNRQKLFDLFKNKKMVAIFYGRICATDIPSLGPEPIGSFGCKQYKTTDMCKELSSQFKTVNSFYFEDNYLFICKNKL